MAAPVAAGVRRGGCQCGAVRYEITGEPREIFVCHCRECQKQSASAFGISIMVPRPAFLLVRGTPRFWTRATDSSRRLECAFCPDCGSRLWHQYDPRSDPISVKGGSLDAPPDLTHAIHIWTSRKLVGVVLPAGAATFPEEPC